MKTASKLIVLFLLVILSVNSFGCATKTTSASAKTTAANAVFKVIDPSGKTIYFSLDELRKLPQGSIILAGKAQQGPTVPGLLAKAGITQYKSVVFKGKTRATWTLKKAQINNKTILDFTNRNTTKLVSPKIQKADWVKDITTITVK